MGYLSDKIASTVVMDYALLDVGERWMNDLLEKAKRVSEALKQADIPHAVIGGLAVATHVATVDPAAVRNTRDMDLLLREEDIERAKSVLEPLGFKYRVVKSIPAFITENGRFRDAVHLIWAGRKVRQGDLHSAPRLAPENLIGAASGFVCISVSELLCMKLTSFRLKDQVHIQDMLGLGLITPEIEAALPTVLVERLQQVKATTEAERLDDEGRDEDA